MNTISSFLGWPVRNLVALTAGLWLLAAAGSGQGVAKAATAAAPADPGLATAADAPRLIGVLGKADASTYEKARACQQLAILGSPEAVPALAPWLADPQLAGFARAALEQIPGARANDALRAAVPSLQGALLAGVVNSLGVRGDPASVTELKALSRDPARGAAVPALIALGRIANAEAVEVLRQHLSGGVVELRSAAAEACLIAAEIENARGRKEASAGLYDAVRSAEVPSPLRLAALRGAILARGEAGVPQLTEALRSAEPAVREMAIRVSREMGGAAVTRTLAGALEPAAPEMQVLLVRALADRGDRSVRGPVERLAESDAPAVRSASLEALGVLGEASSVPVLLRAVANETRPAAEADLAGASLVRLGAANTDAAILDALPSAKPPTRARLIGILGYRRATSATGTLLRYAEDADPAVSKAAFEALAAVATPRDLPPIIRAALATKDPAAREKAERAIYATSLRNPDAARRSEALATAYRETTDPAAKGSLMQVMAMLGDGLAYQTIAGAARETTPTLREAALRHLAGWPDPTPAPVLLEIFKSTDNETHRTLALRGLVTLATLWTDEPVRTAGQGPRRPPRQSVEWLTQANAAIRNQVEEKRTVLSGLGTLNCGEGLALLQPYLEDATVRRDAQLAYLRASRGLTETADRKAARPWLEKILSNPADADVRQQVQEVLKAIPADGS